MYCLKTQVLHHGKSINSAGNLRIEERLFICCEMFVCWCSKGCGKIYPLRFFAVFSAITWNLSCSSVGLGVALLLTLFIWCRRLWFYGHYCLTWMKDDNKTDSLTVEWISTCSSSRTGLMKPLGHCFLLLTDIYTRHNSMHIAGTDKHTHTERDRERERERRLRRRVTWKYRIIQKSESVPIYHCIVLKKPSISLNFSSNFNV